MANPLDQFDNDPPALGGWTPAQGQARGQPAQGTQAAGSNPLDQFDNDPSAFGGPPLAVQPTQGEPSASVGSVAAHTGFGLLKTAPHMVEGVANDVEGMPSNELSFHNPATGESMFSQLGRDFAHSSLGQYIGLKEGEAPAPDPYQAKSGPAIQSGLSAIGLNPDNLPAARNAPERIAETTGEVAGSVLLPELLVGRLGMLGDGAQAGLKSLIGTGTGKVAVNTEPMIGTGTLGSMATNTAKGAAAGLGSGVAQEAVPDEYKPAAGLIGGLAGGLAGEAPQMAISGVKKAYSSIPVLPSQIEAGAARKLYGAAEDPQAAIAAIGSNPNPELVPGSAPTTGQLTGDKGILSLEGAVSRQSPDEFIARREAQNAARTDALNSLQPSGDPAEVGAFFRDQLQDLDHGNQALLDQATTGAQQAVGRLGGTQSPDVTGAQMRGILDRSAPRMTGGEQAVDATGQQMRGALENSIAQMEAREDALWKAIPKDVNVVSAPLKASIANVYGNMPNIMKTTLSAPERNIADEIASYGSQIPIQDLNALRTVVNTEMRTARSPMQPNYLAYGRLSQVRGSIDDAIEASVTGRAAAEQRAVAAGEMAPEDTMAAKWEQAEQDAARRWNADSNAEAVGSAGPGSIRNARGQASPVSDVAGAEGQTGRGSNNPAGNPGVAAASGNRPLIDEAGSDAIKSASAATKEKKTLTQAQPIAGILQRPYETSPYNVADASVPGRIWRSGSEGNSTVTRYLNATKASPEAVGALREAAAQSLRSEAAVNGFLSEQGFRSWRQKYAAPLQRLERASPGITQSLQASASNVGSDVRGILTSPDIANAAVPSMIWKKGTTGAQSVRDYLATAKNDPAAIGALKEAASNSLLSEIDRAKTGGILDESTFSKWRANHADALRELEHAAPGTMAEYGDAASASAAVERAAANQKAQRDAYEKSLVGKLSKIDSDVDITKRVGKILTGDQAVGNMRQLAQEAAKNPAAMEGLRKAVADYISGEMIGNTEAGTSGNALLRADRFQTFVRKNGAALREVLSPEEVGSLHAIAADLQRSARSMNATKIPGGSDTAQNLAGMAKHGESKGESILSRIVMDSSAALAGHMVAPGVGAIGGVALREAVSALRHRGLQRIDAMVREALLNPELARTLLMKVPTSKGAGISVANRIMRAAAIGMVPTQPRSEQRN